MPVSKKPRKKKTHQRRHISKPERWEYKRDYGFGMLGLLSDPRLRMRELTPFEAANQPPKNPRS